MLFSEKLASLRPEVDLAVEELFNTIKRTQTHDQDLLLIEINGFFDQRLENTKISPYVFGPGGWIYSSDLTQYRFFDKYRKEIENTPRKNWFSDFSTNTNKQLLYDFTLQIELMVYLKFWESDVMLRKLYQLSNLAQGKIYDWYFSINKDDSRHILIREVIRDPIKNICPKYFKLLKDIYLSQIRNAAAHSQFYVEQGKLGFNNYDPNDFAPLSQIDFEDWEDRFHKLVLMYNALIKNFNQTHTI